MTAAGSDGQPCDGVCASLGCTDGCNADGPGVPTPVAGSDGQQEREAHWERPRIEDIYEDDGDDLGSWMGLLIHGHHDDETAVALAWSYMEYERADIVGLDPPRRTWLRKVPRNTFMAFTYRDAPGPGLTPVTRMERPSRWQLWCDVPRCGSQFVRGSAVVGWHVARFTVVDFPLQQPEMVYGCRKHADAWDRDERRQIAERMAEMKRVSS